MGCKDNNYILSACRCPENRERTLATQNSRGKRAQMQRDLIFTCSPHQCMNRDLDERDVLEHGFNASLSNIVGCSLKIVEQGLRLCQNYYLSGNYSSWPRLRR